MQEEVNERTIALAVRTGRMTTDMLKRMLAAFVREQHYRRKYGRPQQKSAVRDHGKQSLKKLMKDGSQLSNIEITESNIKSFDRVARKYSIDYSLKKDVSGEMPRYIVFFRAKDIDVMTAAFREYTGLTMTREERRQSVTQRLEKAMDRAINHRERIRNRNRTRGQER